MLEKMKDIVYDMSDVILSLLIIAMIFFVVSWKISDSMAFEITAPDKPTASVTLPEETTAPVIDPPVIVDVTPGETPSTGGKPKGGEVTILPDTEVRDIVLEIKPGSSGYSIAKQLEDEGLIPDTTTFINRLDERELSTKLQSGSFKLKSDMDMDQIIDKLTGR